MPVLCAVCQSLATPGKRDIIPSMSKSRPIADLLPSLTRNILGQRGLLFGKLIADWPALAGEISQHAVPLKLTFAKKQEGKSQAILHLATSATYALEISYQKAILIERLNSFFGYAAIKDIKFIHQDILENKTRTPSFAQPLTIQETQNLEAAVEKIQENDLQTALKNLGKAVISRKKR